MRNDLNAIICRLEDLSNNLQTPAELHPHADLDPADNPASSLICLHSLMAALLGGAAPAGTHEEAWKRGLEERLQQRHRLELHLLSLVC